jgi:hypothetical protein
MTSARETHSHPMVPTDECPVIAIVSNTVVKDVERRCYAGFANDGAVTLGDDGVATFLEDLRYPILVDTERDVAAAREKIQRILRTYYSAAIHCNARIAVCKQGVPLLISMPPEDLRYDDPLDTKEFPNKPPVICEGDFITYAYGPAYWFKKTAFVVEEELAEQQFNSLITEDMVKSLQMDGIPILRHTAVVLDGTDGQFAC